VLPTAQLTQLALIPLRKFQHRKTFSSGLDYRPDIDGLRALAILPVLLFHAGIPGFRGGFIGVDIFFVISGYLMARLIVGEINQANFNLLRFYERRIRRIFPALFAMMAATAIVAWIYFMPVEFEYFARSLKAAALFISNVQFEKEHGYFDVSAQLKPLLHTWSLAVEEQFYIIFPIVLVVIAKIARQRVLIALLPLFAASLAASVWMVEHAPAAAFYLLPFRAWELLMGALLALGIVPDVKQPFLSEIAAGTGILLIALAVLAFNDGISFPGLAALVPCVGAALVIHAGADRGLVGHVLKSTPLVFVGRISYSLYLWHWPLIVFVRYRAGRELTITESMALVAGSLCIAVLSWQVIEKPFRRHSSPIGWKTLVAGSVTAMTAAVIFGRIVIHDSGLPDRLPENVRAVYSATYDVGRFSKPECLIDTHAGSSSLPRVRSGDLCKLGPGSVLSPAFLVWGDSHAAAMAPAIDDAASEVPINGLLAARSSCPPLLDVALTKDQDSRRCAEHNKAVRDLIKSRHIPVVFMIAYWPKYIHRSELPDQGVFFDASRPAPVDDWSAPVAQALDRTLADLTRSGTKVVLVMDVPEMGHYVPEALAQAAMVGRSSDIAPPLSYILRRQALGRTLIERYSEKYGTIIIDPLPSICSEDHCNVVRDGTVLYRDADHLSASGAKSLSYLYAPLLKSFMASTFW